MRSIGRAGSAIFRSPQLADAEGVDVEDVAGRMAAAWSESMLNCRYPVILPTSLHNSAAQLECTMLVSTSVPSRM